MPGAPPILNTCPTCGRTADVSAAEPFSVLTCAGCGQTLRVRREFDHFLIVREVGVGGMSRVFEAEDRALGRHVALKILNRECSQNAVRLAQFEREARLTASFSHPHVVKVYSVGRDQGYFYIAMELVPGGSLDDRIRSTGIQSEDEVLGVAIEIVKGLRAAHTAGLIHRDIKPGNILFADDGTAKLVDFGLALIQGKDEDESEELWATPFYVPPEKLNGETESYRGDMYSLGASLFHALAGRPPCTRDTGSIEELRRIKSFPVHLRPVAPHVSEETCAIIDRLLARKPEHRYRNYDELLEHFEFARKRLATRTAQEQRPHARWEKWWQQNVRRFAVASALAAAVIIGALLLGRAGSGGASRAPASVVVEAGDSGDSATPKYLRGRQVLLAGNFSEARALFEEIASSPSARQPTLNWSRFHAGLCALFEGRSDVARQSFRAMLDGIPWAATAEEKELSAFFQDAATVLQSPDPIQEAVVDRFSPFSVRVAALLPLGLTCWNDGRSDEAATIFQRFRDAAPPPAVAWLQEYKPLLHPFFADLEIARRIPVLDPNTPLVEARAAAAAAERIVAGIHLPHGLKPRRQKEIADFLAALDAREKREVAAQAASEEHRAREELAGVEQAAAQARPLSAGYRFAAGVELFKALPAGTDPARHKRDDRVFLWESAEEFMRQLQADLAANGFTGTVERVGQPPVKGSIVRASREKWLLRSEAGETVVDVASVSPPFLVSLAERFAEQTADSDQHFRRRGNIVAFARLTALHDYARVAGESLMRESRPFRDRWSRLARLD